MQNRLKKLKSVLGAKNLEVIIVTNPTNIFYLSGFRSVSPLEREAILIVSSNAATLITARLYQAEALKIKSKDLLIKIAAERSEINEFVKDAISKVGLPTKTKALVAFEEHDLKFSEFKEFKKLLSEIRPTSFYSSSDSALQKSREVSSLKFSTSSNNNPLIKHKLIPTKHLVEDLRVIKTTDEIKNIERAQIISQKAFNQVIKTLKIGQREAEIAEKLAQIIKNLGSQGLAFESIIASGPNSALPHHVTGSRKIKHGEVLLFDFGAKYNNYSADLSRTIFVGRAHNTHAKIYHHVALAQQKAIAKIRAGLRAAHVHKSAADHFKKHELNDYFLHSLGHGIGLEIHEKPSVSRKSKDTLEEDMVFSVEPGLYFPQWGGVRIEDLITIKNGRAKILGKSAAFVQISI